MNVWLTSVGTTLAKWFRVMRAHIQRKGTRWLGIVQGTVAALAGVAGVIPDNHLKYWLAVSAVLTFWRGQVNDSNGNPS